MIEVAGGGGGDVVVAAAVAASNTISCPEFPDCNFDSIERNVVVAAAVVAVDALPDVDLVVDKTNMIHLCLCHMNKGCLSGSSALC